MNHLARYLILLLTLTLPFYASAENSTRTGGYTIHHNAITTDSLPIQVANSYGIQRSKSRALLNVSVVRDVPGKMGTPVHAQVRVAAKTLFGQIRPIELREIVEDQAIYYIADFPVAHREVLLFQFEVLPNGARYALQATMRQEFWTD